MHFIYDQFMALMLELVNFDVKSVKGILAGVGLLHVWNVTFYYIFNYNVWIVGLLPCLILERRIPAVPIEGSKWTSLKMDAIYPIIGGLLVIPFADMFIKGITNFYHQILPFLDTGLLAGKPIWLQLLGAFLITEFMYYSSHRLKHEIKWLWYFHAIHHSQENLNPMTNRRAHFAEDVINAVIRTLPIAFVGGAPITWTIYLVLNSFWVSFIHSNIRTNLGPFKYIIVSPQFHRVHHSVIPEHFNMNYGERLIVWDFLFGTMVKDFNCYPPTGVKGIERWVIESEGTPKALIAYWFKQAFYPFYKIGQSVEQEVARVIQFAKSKSS
jgi:sterol desaturase/sphingolipid hydroxylase (fatty acid hydroxylase superfamily)